MIMTYILIKLFSVCIDCSRTKTRPIIDSSFSNTTSKILILYIRTILIFQKRYKSKINLNIKDEIWNKKNIVHFRNLQFVAKKREWYLNPLLACPSAWSIQVSFFYVPKKYPNRIREKKQSPWTIQILSQNFFLNLAMFKIFSMSQKLSGEKKQTPWTIQIVSDTSGT